MANRKSKPSVTDTLGWAAEAKSAKSTSGEASKGAALQDVDVQDSTTAGINLPKDYLALLKAVAQRRAQEQGGRPSVSAVVCDLVRQHADELDEEARQVTADYRSVFRPR